MQCTAKSAQCPNPGLSVGWEEAEAKEAPATLTSGDTKSVEIDPPIRAPDCRSAWPNSGQAPMIGAAPLPRAIWRPSHEPVRKTAKAQFRQRLNKVADAWDDFQASRARDAVYGYLEAVFATVAHYKVRRRTNRLLRHAFNFAGLPFDDKADPFTAVIYCTCDDDVDNKTISKWARALRYVARSKVGPSAVESVYEGSRRGQRMCRWIFKASWKGCQVRSAGSRG